LALDRLWKLQVISLPYRVALDSNFLLLPLNLRLDIFIEIERLLQGKVQFIVIKPVRNELGRLSQRGSELGRRASFALKLMERCLEIDVKLNRSEKVDEALIRFAQDNKVIVATSDMVLKKRLRDINVPVIYVRDLSRLEIEGFPIRDGY
jgi:rRNA-processing protein FCF1